MANGTVGNDTLTGPADRGAMRRSGGGDHIFGIAGSNLTFGGAGNDGPAGAVGNDPLCDRGGSDALFGAGRDHRLCGGIEEDLTWEPEPQWLC